MADEIKVDPEFLPECPECFLKVEQDELDAFGGFCENCREDSEDDDNG